MVGLQFTMLKEAKNEDKVMKGSQTQFSQTHYQLWRTLQIIDVTVDQSLMLCDLKWLHVLWITQTLNISGDRHSSWKTEGRKGQESSKRWENIPSKSHYLVSSWSESSCFRCLERSFFSIERRTQARAFPTSVLISLMFWMCLHVENTFRVRAGQLCI